jgi:Toprim-like
VISLYQAAAGRGHWLRVSRTNCCPVCGHPDWCLIAKDGSAAICARVESRKVVGNQGAGWLHILDERQHSRLIRPIVTTTIKQTATTDWLALAQSCTEALTAKGLIKLAESLGLTVASLIRLNVGWHREQRAYTFPMRDADGRIIGIRLRRPNGFKFAVNGSKTGLFFPADILDIPVALQRLCIAEGPTDCAALLDMGLVAVGRPSCNGGVALLTQVVRRLRPATVVIVADGDQAGQTGAMTLANVLSTMPVKLASLTPPQGIKDVRAWKQHGATVEQFTVSIGPISHPAIRRAQRRAVMHRQTLRSRNSL